MQRFARVPALRLRGSRLGHEGLQQAGPAAEAVVDGEAGDPGSAGHSPDTDRSGRSLGDHLTGRGEDRMAGPVDRCLAAAEAVGAVHRIKLTYCL